MENINVNNIQTIPSPIVQVKAEVQGVSYIINIPKLEVNCINGIFKNNEYPILGCKNRRNRSGTMTIIDIGANVGVFAIYAKILYPDSIVHCFEPCPHTFELLLSNIGHIPGIHAYPIGLSNRTGEAIMNIHPCNTGENSIRFKFKNNKDIIFNDTIDIIVQDAGEKFDNLEIKYIDILKIDTEGCEVDILKSLKNVFSTTDYILVEYHSEADRRSIDNILRDFHLYYARAGAPGQGIIGYINVSLLEK